MDCTGVAVALLLFENSKTADCKGVRLMYNDATCHVSYFAV